MLPDDKEIMLALTRDNVDMFEKVFKHYYSRLCSYAAGIIDDSDEAEDIVQHTMIKIWEKRAELEIVTSLKSYLYRAVHNAALNKIKQNKVRTVFADDYKHRSSSHTASASQKVIQGELEHAIAEAIDKLPEQCRLVFKLSRFEEMKYSEIATHLGISIKTVENHMGKALKLMRTNLKDFIVLIIVTLTHIVY